MINKDDLQIYHNLDKKGVNIFNLGIIHEILCHEDVDCIEDEKLLKVANLVLTCYLKSVEEHLGQIVEAVLLNYTTIIREDMSPRQILAKFI